jgi:hypothetical protein
MPNHPILGVDSLEGQISSSLRSLPHPYFNFLSCTQFNFMELVDILIFYYLFFNILMFYFTSLM